MQSGPCVPGGGVGLFEAVAALDRLGTSCRSLGTSGGEFAGEPSAPPPGRIICREPDEHGDEALRRLTAWSKVVARS